MKIYDLLGIGIGPSNLSTAALLDPLKSEKKSIFFDNKEKFSWHPGLMFPDAKLQVSILKDLVTMLDPTSKFSFLNYLRQNKKIYIFAAKNGFNNVKRREFEDYLKWAVSKLENLHFSSEVDTVTFDHEVFHVKVNGKMFHSKNISMGAGLTACMPVFARPYLSSTLFHSSQFLKEYNNFSGKQVTIIGGGQSSCEILKFILQLDSNELPSKINWIFKGHNVKVLENTPFANELYTPNYSNYIYSVSMVAKEKLIGEQKHTSDGVSEETLNQIYDLLYDNKFTESCEVSIYNDSMLTGIIKSDISYGLEINGTVNINSDIVILGTGFEYKIPTCINELSKEYLTENGVFMVDEKYRLIKKSNVIKGDIFLHNGAKHIRGLADPNLSLLAWRSGIIINTLLNRDAYDVENEGSIINWYNKNVVIL